jgi:hypothetical protein
MSNFNNDNQEKNFYSYLTSNTKYPTLFNQQLMSCIKRENHIDLIKFLNQPDCINIIKQFSYEVLSSIVSIMHSKNNIQNKNLNSCCKKVLHYLVIYCEPSELILYLIEQMELSNIDDCFFSLLNPLEMCLFKCKNPILVIDMCIDNIKNFLLHLPLPDDEDKNKTNIMLERIILSYINISKFVDNLLQDLQLLSSNINSHIQTKIKYSILDLMISLFDKPMSFINLNCDNYKLLFQKLIRNISSIQYDIIYFFRLINHGNIRKYCTSSKKTKFCSNSEEIDTFLNLNDLAFCNFYWTVLYEVLDVWIPQIYNPYYIAYNCINISNYLMLYKEEKNITVIKGLDLMYYVLNIIKRFLIPFEDLDLLIHHELIKNLTHYIIYGNSSKIKKYALNNFIKYVNSFSNKAKYSIINKLISLDYHSKIKGFIIGITKNIVSDSLNSKKNSHQNEMFAGKNLQLIISNICILKNGSNTDLLEISDQIIVILNFILFLIIRDKNNSGIINFFKKTNYSFLRSVQNAVETQKNQYIFRLDCIIKHKDIIIYNEKRDLFFEEFGLIPFEQKIQIYSQAVNTLLLIENILCRIYDFVDIKLTNM